MNRSTTLWRKTLAMVVTLVTAAGILVAGAAPASAADYFKLPYPAGEAYRVNQGPGGSYSHYDQYNRYAWDFGLPANYEVSAAQGGWIVISDWSPYWQNGIEVIIRHPNGTCTHYAHLNQSFYWPGNWVPQGRVVGYSGATGAANGPHLHFQVINCNTRVGLYATLQGWVPQTGSWPVSQNYYA